MRTLVAHLRRHKSLVVLALVLAAVNQCFSLLDPLIFRYVIDRYATQYAQYSTAEFLRGVGLLLAAAMGVALVSRTAKNFQDYFVSVIISEWGRLCMPRASTTRWTCRMQRSRTSVPVRRWAA